MSGFDSFGDDPQLAAAHLRSAGVDYEAIRAKWKGAAHVGIPTAVPTDSHVVPEARREKNAQTMKKLSKFIVCERCAGSGLFKELYNHRYMEKNCVDCDGNGLLLRLQNGKTVPYDSHDAEVAELARQQDEPASAEDSESVLSSSAMNASENAAAQNAESASASSAVPPAAAASAGSTAAAAPPSYAWLLDPEDDPPPPS